MLLVDTVTDRKLLKFLVLKHLMKRREKLICLCLTLQIKDD